MPQTARYIFIQLQIIRGMHTMDKRDLISVFDYEAAARAKLPKTAYDYYRSGANDEITLHENHAAYERIKLKPKVLLDTSKRDLSTTVLGQTVSMPILVAPTAFHRMAHPEGEVATARAAGQAGTIMMLSTLAVDGEQGAKRVLDILRKDFELTMRLCGCATIADIDKDLLF